MFAYEGYCYPDQSSLSQAYSSRFHLANNPPTSFQSVDSGDTPDSLYFAFDTFYPDPTTHLLVSYHSNKMSYFEYCDTAGPLTTQTGLTVDDAVLLTSAIVLTWVIAWSIKILRRAL
jgi:hypothetical protein